MMKYNVSRRTIVFASCLVAFLFSFVPAVAGTDDANPEYTWAQKIEKRGLPNFNKVSDDLYRGAQPTAEGMKELKKMGIKTIINLRSFHSDRRKMAGTDFNYEHIMMKPWHAEDEDVVRFLKIVTDKNKMPVFIHCQHGADRTGTLSAIYRIAIQGWPVEEAIREMKIGGFGYHVVWKNLESYLKRLDMQKIRKEAGLTEDKE
jgi:protein tyrosine/serine phosphatase